MALIAPRFFQNKNRQFYPKVGLSPTQSSYPATYSQPPPIISSIQSPPVDLSKVVNNILVDYDITKKFSAKHNRNHQRKAFSKNIDHILNPNFIKIKNQPKGAESDNWRDDNPQTGK